MSASQVTVIVLILAAFALGWWGHGWRQGARPGRPADGADPGSTPLEPPISSAPAPAPAEPTPAPAELPRAPAQPPPAPAQASPAQAELDAVLQSTVIAYHAALAVWQAQATQSAHPTPLAGQAVAAFERQRAALTVLAPDPDASPEARAALERARRAAERLSQGLTRLGAGEALEIEHERALIGAERALTSARYALLAASASPR